MVTLLTLLYNPLTNISLRNDIIGSNNSMKNASKYSKKKKLLSKLKWLKKLVTSKELSKILKVSSSV